MEFISANRKRGNPTRIAVLYRKGVKFVGVLWNIGNKFESKHAQSAPCTRREANAFLGRW